MTLYEQLKAAGCEIDNHCSDLYTPVTDVSTELVRRSDYRAGGLFGVSVRTFVNEVTGRLSYDIFGAYDPFWEGKR